MLTFVVEHGITTPSLVGTTSIVKVSTPMGREAWGSPSFSRGAVVDVAVVHVVSDIDEMLTLLLPMVEADNQDDDVVTRSVARNELMDPAR